MTDNPHEDMIRFFAGFFDYNKAARERFEKEDGQFVHYTTAETAIKVLSERSVWLRNAVVMNDFSEIDHGLSCVNAAWQEQTVGIRLQNFLEFVYPGSVDEIINEFNAKQGNIKFETYLFCMSEHLSSERDFGRLSMWRAYGGRNGVAIVMNRTPFYSSNNALKAYSFPVAYKMPQDFIPMFSGIVDRILADEKLIRQIPRQAIVQMISEALRWLAMTVKHPAFAEEREWRVIYAPEFERSDVITPSVEVIRGVPQIVQKLPLLDDPQRGLVKADIASLVERVIIGPTDASYVIGTAIADRLRAAEVQNIESKIKISGIPLRHNV